MTTPRLRLLTPDDAAELGALVRRNREHLAPWDPERPEEFWTVEGQATRLASMAAALEAGRTVPYAITVDDGIVGQITLDNVVRGPLQSANVGYWIDRDQTGRGIASAALTALVPLAFGEHRLHRLEAGTMLTNRGSQRVLLKNGFVQYGMAPKFLKIGGTWQDHVLFQLINDRFE